MVDMKRSGIIMAARQFLIAALWLMAASWPASAEPAAKLCTASFAQADGMGAFASADIRDGNLERLYVEMGPTRSALVTQGEGIAKGYTSAAPELSYWSNMSIYQPAKDWLTPGGVRLDYSGFRIGWPEFRKGREVVKALTLTVTQGDEMMSLDVGQDANGAVINSRVIAIDFECMLPGVTPAVRLPDHRNWRVAAEQKRPMSVAVMDAKTGKVMALGDITPLTGDSAQALLSGGLNALRDKFRAGQCSA